MHSDTPSLSVLLASCNGEKFIAQQIRSIMAQTYTDFQLIICDDNSRDATVRIIQTFQSKYPNIILHRNTTTLGYVKNFEKLIGLCHTPYIALCDQDDIWEPEKLAQQMYHMHQTETKQPALPVLIHSDLSVHDANGNRLYPSYFAYRGYVLSNQKDLGHILGPCGVMGNTVLFNRALQKRILPFPPMLKNHDYWIALVCELFGTRVTLDTPLVQYRLHTDNASNPLIATTATQHSMQYYLRCLRGSCRLPYVGTQRENVLEYLLEHYTLDDEAKRIIEAFLKYLRLQGSKSDRIYDMMRYSYVKKGVLFRVKTALKILLKST